MRKHTVHTRHPRYKVNQYSRGSGAPVLVAGRGAGMTEPLMGTKPPESWYKRAYLELDQNFREKGHLNDIEDNVWQHGYLSEKAGRPHALMYIDVSDSGDAVTNGYRDSRWRTLENKEIIYEIKMIPTTLYFTLAAQARKRHGASPSAERGKVEARLATKYAHLMQGGNKFPLPYIDFDASTQEGRHRIAALELLGINQTPVMIIREAKPEEMPPPPFFHKVEPDGRESWTKNPDYHRSERRSPVLTGG